MVESVIFSHRGVTVGYSHLKVGSEAYPIKDIISAEERMLKPKRILARLLVFAGLPLILCRGLYPLLGLVLMLAGLFIGRAAKIRYALVIYTRAGEYMPLISENSLDITNVLSALNVALAMQGGIWRH